MFCLVVFADCRPCGVGCLKQPLTAEFRIHTVVNLVDPAAEGCLVR
jgi:hypothetical protein